MKGFAVSFLVVEFQRHAVLCWTTKVLSYNIFFFGCHHKGQLKVQLFSYVLNMNLFRRFWPKPSQTRESVGFQKFKITKLFQ